MGSKKLFDEVVTSNSKNDVKKGVKRTKTMYSKEFYAFAKKEIDEKQYNVLFHSGKFPVTARVKFVKELKAKFPEYKDVKWENMWHRLYLKYILNNDGKTELLDMKVATAPVESVEKVVEKKPKVEKNRNTIKDGAEILYGIFKERFELSYKENYIKVTSKVPHDRLDITEKEARELLKLGNKYGPIPSLRGLLNKMANSIKFNEKYVYYVYNFMQYTLDGVVRFRFDIREKYGWNYKVGYKLCAKFLGIISIYNKDMCCNIKCTQSELPHKLEEIIDNEINNTKLIFGIKPKLKGNPSIVLGEQFDNIE